jgi:hypothetical protein
MSKVYEFFDKDGGENLYNVLFNWNGHSLESQQAFSQIMSFGDSAYEWWKKLNWIEYCENEKYFGVILTDKKRNYIDFGVYETEYVESKYYIKKSVVEWAMKNAKSWGHMKNILRKNFKCKSIEKK